MFRRLPHGARLLALVALLIALVAAGCGGSDSTSSSSNGPDPATVAPADAAVYGQAIVRPEGDMKAGVVAAARKVLLVDDPGAELKRLLDGLSEPGRTTYADDIEPWLGQRIGSFLLMPSDGSDDPDWAIALAIADRGAFDDALPHLRADDQREAGSYRGVRYDQDTDDSTIYFAPVGDFYVGGSLAGLRAAIDASKGSSLADDSRFTDAVADVPDDALAFVYADPKAIVSAAGSLEDAPANARKALARLAEGDPVTASLTATADEIAIEASGGEQVTEALDSDSDAEVTVGQLPGDSWLALATPPLGPIIRNALAGAGVHDEAAAQVQQNVGLDLDRDLLEPLGGLGVFVRGESLLDMGGGALLQMTDAAAAQRLLTRIQAIVGAGLGVPVSPLAIAGARGFQVQIPQSPQPIVVLAKGDRLAAGYAASSAQDLLDPQQRFDDSTDGKAAIDTLGAGYTPSFVLIVPPLAGLLRSLDQLEVADLSSVLPYVDAYRSLAIGTKRDGDRTSVRIVAALR
ncbi:MAG TPA: DUF3352 domain-containing protein [Conexibacter sp.]|jgi:hypothetical protein|nr:DUF3352 domain-containing protein [Conexibacter sp.]